MKRAAIIMFLLLVILPSPPFAFDAVDEFVFDNLYTEVINSNRIICFIGPVKTDNPMPSIKFYFEKISEKDIKGVFLNNLDVTSQAKIVPLKERKGGLAVSYEPRTPLKEGYHTVIVRVKKDGGKLNQACFYLVKIEINPSKTDELKNTKLDSRIPRIFSDLFANQHKVKGLFASVKETVDNINNEV